MTAVAAFWPGSSALAESSINPPDGWQHTRMVIENYSSPHTIGGFTPTVNIVSDNLTIDEEIDVLHQRLKSMAVPVTVDQPVDCSGGQRAQSVIYTSSQSTGIYTFRQLLLEESNGTKVITYTKPAGSPDDPVAIEAIQSVCSE